MPLQGTPIYCKFYRHGHRRRRLPWPVPSRAVVEAWAYQRLQALGIPTPQVVAVGELRHLGLLEAAAIVTQEVPDSLNLAQFANDVWLQMSRRERRTVAHQIVESLVSQLRTAHAAGFHHQDLKWRNVLVRQSNGVYETIWIDCPRATERSVFRRRGCVLDLSGLARLALSYLSPVDRLRFIHAYLGPAASPENAKSLSRAVEAHLARRPPVLVPVEPFHIGPHLRSKAEGLSSADGRV